MEPFNSYASYIKSKYGQRIQKVSIEGGFTCPNRDGKVAIGGCTYCNNESFSPHHGSNFSIKQQVETSITKLKRRYKKANKYFAYFQSYSNTYAPLSILKDRFEQALEHPDIIGLSIGTRPDCVDKEILDYLHELGNNYDVTIEYGLESISDETLKRINRGHGFQSFVDAVKMTEGLNIKMCTHLIIGFPWEDREHWIESAKIISKYPIHFLKLHQLHIVKGTKMGVEYLKNPFKLLDEDEYLDIMIEFLRHLRPDIVIQRFFGEAPKEYILTDYWHTSLSELKARLIYEMNARGVTQGDLYKAQ